MQAQAQSFAHVSAMPAPTWHFLNMNDAMVAIPEGLALSSDIAVRQSPGSCALEGSFEKALEKAQAAWEREHPAPTVEELAKRAEFMAAEVDATYGGTAQSAYQIAADAIEDARSLAVAFEHGVGSEFASYLRSVAGERIVVVGPAGKSVDAEVVVTADVGSVNVAAIDVVAEAGSAVSLSIVVKGGAGLQTDEPHSGVAGTTVRVFAGEDARVQVHRTQALGDAFSDIDDMGLFAAKRADISVRQTVLGASQAYAGLAGDLRGDASHIDVDTRYLGRGEQERDFNYSLRHHGAKTKCELKANGVLAGASSKVLRGTIDFVRGCTGAEGSEKETVLLVDEDVHNKTVPVILCNEDDVAGNHGATIGHIREEQLFYLASRGFSQEAAENMFACAIVEQAAIDATTDAARQSIICLGERVNPGFAGLFGEE